MSDSSLKRSKAHEQWTNLENHAKEGFRTQQTKTAIIRI